jgi:hypothetical protein
MNDPCDRPPLVPRENPRIPATPATIGHDRSTGLLGTGDIETIYGPSRISHNSSLKP